jgi:hypothetical protein
MPFTGQLGTGDSYLGNIELAFLSSVQPQPPIDPATAFVIARPLRAGIAFTGGWSQDITAAKPLSKVKLLSGLMEG